MSYKFDDERVLISITEEDIANMLDAYDEHPTQEQFNHLCDYVSLKGTSDYIYDNMNEWLSDDWYYLKELKEW